MLAFFLSRAWRWGGLFLSEVADEEEEKGGWRI
jgi:hypothetical protein